MVVFAAELAQFASEVFAHVPHDAFAVGQDRVGEGTATILRDEYQMHMQVPYRMSAKAY